MIDLSTLKKGDTVKLRGGGELRAKKDSLLSGNSCELSFHGYDATFYFFNDGSFSGMNDTPFDIIEIIPAAFDWDDVEQGMAFMNDCGDVYYYVADDFCNRGYVVISDDERCFNFHCVAKIALTRAPEHDMELKS